MRRSWRGVIALSLVLFLNIVCTQFAVNTYYHEKFGLTIFYALMNLLLFPVSLYIYKKTIETKT